MVSLRFLNLSATVILLFSLFFPGKYSFASESPASHQKYVHQLVTAHFTGEKILDGSNALKRSLTSILTEGEISPLDDLISNTKNMNSSSKSGILGFEDESKVNYHRAMVISNLAKTRSALSRLNTVLLNREIPDHVKKQLATLTDNLQKLKDELE